MSNEAEKGWGRVTCQPGEFGLCSEGTGGLWRNLSQGVVGSDLWCRISSLSCFSAT